MEHFIAWCAFLGGWLLFAGPIYQAAIELADEAFNRAAFEAVTQRIPPPGRSSPLWWFLPPVAYWLQRRQKDRYRRALLAELTEEEREQLISFFAKAHGWIIVAAGAFFIALKETWELHELYEWRGWAYWALVAGMAFLALLNTVVRMSRGDEFRPHEQRGRRGPGRPPGPTPAA